MSREDILKKFPSENKPEYVKNWQERLTTETDGGMRTTYVARLDGKVVGFTAPRIEDDGKRRIGAMYVATEAHGKGVGGALMRRALEWHGTGEDIYLEVVSYNEQAIGFYEHFGFRKTGVTTPLEFDEAQGMKLLPETEMVLRAQE